MGNTTLATVLAVLAAAAPSAADRTALEETVVEIFKPYTAETDQSAAWDFPIYSAEVTALIAHWRSVAPKGELDGLNDGDWLCQCQDWDGDAFQATIVSIGMTDADTAEVEMRVDLGLGEPASIRTQRLTVKREDGAWKVDEIVADGFADGLRQALRQTIAEDEALAGERE